MSWEIAEAVRFLNVNKVQGHQSSKDCFEKEKSIYIYTLNDSIHTPYNK